MKIASIDALMHSGRKEIGPLSKRERFLIGVALYVAEGTKYDGKFEFTNTNPQIVSFMISWLREFCTIKEEKIRISLWLHCTSDEKLAKAFWIRITGVKLSQFQKTYIARNIVNSKKIRKNRHEYGVCSIRYHDVLLHRRLMGWISGIFTDTCYNNTNLL